MSGEGTIYALDLARVAGWAVGRADGDVPRSGTWTLKRPDQPQGVAFLNLKQYLVQEFEDHPPAVVAVEAPYHLGAFAKAQNAESTVRMAYGLHAIAWALALNYGARFVDEEPATIRKHFLGVARLGDREATKRAVVSRCHVLEYFPRSYTDDNRADACAIFDWAASTIMRRAPRVLTMYPPKPEPKSRRRKVA